MSDFMKKFDRVVSLNYDLSVYWAIQVGNKESSSWMLKDCFVKGRFFEDWEVLSEPYKGSDGATLVFFPHGSLFLASELNGRDFKIARESEYENLLNVVLERWESGEVTPLFVAEGDTRQKLSAIKRSEYLQQVYREALPEVGASRSIVVYGWSLAENDDHIASQIFKTKRRDSQVAYFIYTQGRSLVEIEEEVERVRSRLKRANPYVAVAFYDSASPGVWINPFAASPVA